MGDGLAHAYFRDGGRRADGLDVESTDPARRRYLRIEQTWPWASAFTTRWRRLTQLPAVT